ncbi:DNA-directed RNA polymerase subunit P [Candidatus Micrarchaeota archaeon]|nr:DNA-directed RNA polymerase subunit P [Candidatus Micrarchaeota archaeon]
MNYVCSDCGKEFDGLDSDFIRCLYCDSKVLFKKTPPILKTFSTD